MHTITIESEPFIGVKLHVTGTEGYYQATVHRSLKEVWLNKTDRTSASEDGEWVNGLSYQKDLADGIVYYLTIVGNSPTTVRYHVVCGDPERIVFTMISDIENLPEKDIQYLRDTSRKTGIPLTRSDIVQR